MTVKGGTTPACAACKYQRRKCTPTCPLAPYFPSNKTEMFRNVHRLFGVSNVTKVLRSLKTKDQRDDAMKSIIYEAEMRERFPVHGCSAVICQLRLQLEYAVEELCCVYTQLAACRQEQQLNSDVSLMSFEKLSIGSEMMMTPHHGVNNNQYFFNENSGFYGNQSSLPNNMLNNNNLAAIQEQMDTFGIQQDRNNILYVQDYDETMLNSTDDKQSQIEAKEGFESSSESSLKDTTQPADHTCRRELETAAAGFSLTTVN